MNYGEIKNCDISNGPGVRVSLFVSGCTHHCVGCFNPMTWDFTYGKIFDIETAKKIIELLKPDYIRGLSLLGGEPMEPENQAALVPMLRYIKNEMPKKDIWCYTGYTFESDILGDMAIYNEDTQEMLDYIDVLVDGEFILEKKDISLKFRGSSNQRLIDVQKSLKANSTILWEED